MATTQRRAGTLYLAVDGVTQSARGKFTYNLGEPKREALIGADGKPHGFKETAQVPFIEGEITDSSDLDVRALLQLDGATVTLEIANGKVIALREAWYAHEGTIDAEEASIPVRFEGKFAEEIA